MILTKIIYYKLQNDFVNTSKNYNKNYVINTVIYFENFKFKNFMDFVYCYARKYNSEKIIILMNYIIKEYKITHLIKKEHKNKNNNKINNKNIIWTA